MNDYIIRHYKNSTMSVSSVTFLFLTIIFCGVSQSVEGPKQINVAFFLNQQDDLNELVIRSSLNIMNYNANNYKIHPFIHRIRKSEISDLANIVCSMLEQGVAAIFGPEDPEANEIIQSVSLSLEIPQFQTFWNPNLETFSALAKSDKPFKKNDVFNFNLYPSPYILSKAFATLVRENDWKSYTILYENDDGLIRLQEVLKAQSPNDPPVTYRKLGSGPDYRTILKEVVVSSAVHIILDCETDRIIDILLQAKDVKLLEEYHSYILTSLDATSIDFSALGQIKTNISFINMLDESVIDRVIGNWELAYINEQREIPPKSIKVQTALLYDALNLFISAFSDLYSEELTIKPMTCGTNEISSHGFRLAAFIGVRNVSPGQGYLVGPMTGLIGLDSHGRRSSFGVQIIELNRQQSRITGIWDSSNPYVINSTITSEDREKEQFEQLRGKEFRVVSRIYPPYLSRKVSEGAPLYGNDAFEGYAMDFVDGICRILNCTYKFELVPDNNYGKYDPKTKEWNGLIGHLLARKADFAVCDLTTTYERRKAVDFTNYFMTLGISILYSKPVKEPPELLGFTKPLSLDVWLYTATAYIVMSMILFIVARMNPHEWENPHPCDPNPEELENIWDIKNCFWLTLGSIMTQGCDILPKGISTRLVTGMWWFFSLIMAACYTANLAAFLTQERMGLTINSAEDLAAQTKIKYGCVKGGATASFFQHTNVTTYHKMWVQMESADPSVFENSNIDGVKRVISSKGKYAFLMESSSIEYEVEKHCELIQVGNRLDTKGYGIAMPTNAPYRTAINQAILKMQEMGQLNRLKKKWWQEKNKGVACKKDEASSDNAATELGLPHVGGVFVVLAGGIVVSLIIAIMEFLWHVRKVAVSQKMTLKGAFMDELEFAMNIWVREKTVRPTAEKKSIPNEENNTIDKN